MERGGEGVGEVGWGSDLSFEVIGGLKVRKYNKKCVVGQIDPPPRSLDPKVAKVT